MNVIYEDENVKVIDKPAGVNSDDFEKRVHRLDKETSGLIILAKKDRAHRWLQDQFRLRKVQKVYLALVDGHPPTPVGRIEVAIGRSAKDRKPA